MLGQQLDFCHNVGQADGQFLPQKDERVPLRRIDACKKKKRRRYVNVITEMIHSLVLTEVDELFDGQRRRVELGIVVEHAPEAFGEVSRRETHDCFFLSVLHKLVSLFSANGRLSPSGRQLTRERSAKRSRR